MFYSGSPGIIDNCESLPVTYAQKKAHTVSKITVRASLNTNKYTDYHICADAATRSVDGKLEKLPS